MTFIEELLTKNYEECCSILLEKYGPAKFDYFKDIECTKKESRNGRGKEGLYLHHIDEDKAIMLSDKDFASQNTFDYQKADRLVYANLLEHLVLHIKIVEFPNPKKNPLELCGIGGIFNFIVPELNDIYSGIEYRLPWKQKVVEVVKPLKDDYFKCLKKISELNIYEYSLEDLLSSFIFNKELGWSIEKNSKLFSEIKELLSI